MVAAKHGLSLDPACFVPALRSCCGLNTGDTNQRSNNDSDDAQGSVSGSEAGASLLGKMWTLAGVVPDAWCTNVVMEASTAWRRVMSGSFCLSERVECYSRPRLIQRGVGGRGLFRTSSCVAIGFSQSLVLEKAISSRSRNASRCAMLSPPSFCQISRRP